ncbi:hypothetical protein GT037_005744 [Alternaria burnsii]|uniref:DJ-1/PfpI domain-containing protein n=1 Tax=Alternaria burnsii TaxID=1187904 RepID=A0A8H7B4J1_9PLEO|nr:uncharacterized protein GT037_005744 [Alternaria burnsii]KAF7676239.1 hypothetical protein GT037_005744 [Alternaria burnsii]
MRYSTLLPALVAFGSTFARPKQPEFTNTTTLPTHFGLVVFPHYQALDIFGPMDLLNTLFMYYQNSTIVPKFSVLSKTMDPVTSAMMTGGFGQEIVPTTTFSDYLASREQSADNHMAVVKSKRQSHDGMHLPPTTDKGDIDVLIVPGGGGTRRNMTEEIDFVKQTYPKLKYIVSVCTGATILSRAGILDGRRATTNKAAWEWAVKQGPNVTWVPTARWVEDGNIISTSGVSAGIDGMYAFLMGKIYSLAESVLVWLGPDDKHSRFLMRLWTAHLRPLINTLDDEAMRSLYADLFESTHPLWNNVAQDEVLIRFELGLHDEDADQASPDRYKKALWVSFNHVLNRPWWS